MNGENRDFPLRRVAATLAAGAVGLTVHVVHVVAGIGLLSLAGEPERDPVLLGFALMQLVVAAAAVPAAIELSRLQRLWLSTGLRLRRTRLLVFALVWIGPLILGVTFPVAGGHPAAGAAFVQFAGILFSTIIVELHRIAGREDHLPSPGRMLVRLFAAVQHVAR